MTFPLLTILLFAPVCGAGAITLLPPSADRTIKLVAASTMGLSFILSLIAFFSYDWRLGGMQFIEELTWMPEIGAAYSLGLDGLSAPMTLLTTLIGFAGVYASWRVEERPKEFFTLFLLLVAGVAGTFVARDLFLFLLFYEVVVIPIYILIILWGSSKRVTKEYAGMKLTIYLLLGSAFLLAGVFMIYLQAFPAGNRTFGMEALAAAGFAGGLTAETQIFIFFFIFIGFGSLLSMWPFHSWSPDGYAGAPTAVSMVHAGVLKKIGGYGLIRVGLMMLPLGFNFWAPLIAALGVVNVAYAAFIALAQKDMKYVVGYSSVSHMGYVLIGIAAASVIGINGAVANMFAHGVMAALFFAMIGHIYHATHTRNIPDLGGLAHQMPKAAVGFVLAGMASLGLPGLISFVPEFTIFVGSFNEFPVMAVIAIAGIVITALYVLRILADVLFGPRRSEWNRAVDLHGTDLVPFVVLSAFLVGFGILPALLMDVINSAVVPLAPLLAKLKSAAILWGGL